MDKYDNNMYNVLRGTKYDDESSNDNENYYDDYDELFNENTSDNYTSNNYTLSDNAMNDYFQYYQYYDLTNRVNNDHDSEEDKSKVNPETEEDESKVDSKIEEDKSKVDSKIEEDKSKVDSKVEEDKSKVDSKVEEDKSKVDPETEKNKTIVDSETEKDKSKVDSKVEEDKSKVDHEIKEDKQKFENKNAIQNTTIYLILPCRKGTLISNLNLLSENNKYIEILDIESTEIISETNSEEIENITNEKNGIKHMIVQEFNNSFENKSIYLYKINIKLNEDTKKFKILFTYNTEIIQSRSNITIHKYQQLFLFTLVYDIINNEKDKKGILKEVKKKFKEIFSNDNSKVKKDLSEGKYEISDLQKFAIYKKYLINNKVKNLIPDLLEEALKNIIEPEKINFEYMLVYFNTVIDNKKLFSSIPKESKRLLEIILSNFVDKEKIDIRKYDNSEYDKLIRLMGSYYIDLKGKSSIGFYLFIILFHQINTSENKFNEFFYKIIPKQDAVDFVIKHKKLFSNLIYTNIHLIFLYADKDKTSLNDVLMLTSSYNDYLRFFSSQAHYIKKKEPRIQFDKCPKPTENTDLELLEKFIDIVTEMDLENIDINHIKNKIFLLISSLNGKNYEKLIKLKRITLNHRNISMTESIIKKIDEALHTTGKIYIENDRWGNMDILNYIQEDVKVYYNEYKSNKQFATLIEHINLDKVDDKFIKKFIGNVEDPYDYNQQFGNNYKEFISSIVKNVRNYRHLRIAYNLFNMENNLKQNTCIIDNLIDTFIGGLERNNMEFGDIEILVAQLYRLISNNDNYCMNRLIDGTKSNFNQNESNEIFIFILNNFSNELNTSLNEKLVKSISDFSYGNALDILGKLKNEKVSQLILNKLGNRVIRQDEIFAIKPSENLKFLFEFVRMGYFNYDNEQFKNVVYINKSLNIIYKTIDQLNDFNFTINQLQNMNQLYKLSPNNYYRKYTELESRFYILALGDYNSPVMKQLYPKIVNKIKSCNNTLEKMEEIINIFKNYYPNEKREIIQNFENIRNDILNNPIMNFPSEEYLNNLEFEKKYNEAHQISQLKNSKIFTLIHDYQKENDDDEESDQNKDNAMFDRTKSKFLNLKKLFDSTTEEEINLEFLNTIFSKLKYNEIDKEINIIKDIFRIQGNPTNRIHEKLRLLNNRNNNINLYKKVILLLNDFDLNSNKIRDHLCTVIEELTNFKSLKDLIETEDLLKSLNLNIFNLNSKHNSNACTIITKMYEEPLLIKFIKDKNINDIHQMGEFIDDSEDFSISLADIDQLETCMTFLQELKEKSDGKSENEFLEIFVKTLKDNNNYRDIGIKFVDSSGKYSDFYELYTNHLNPNELNKVHIRKIYENSEFKIINDYPEYKCTVCYYNNNKYVKKDNEEMLDLRTVALLRKKDQREKDYFDVCEKFAKIISDIQEILKLLELISSKGYFEDREYQIDVIEGNTVAKKIISNIVYEDDGKDLEDVINELNDILEDQNKKVKLLYMNDQSTRMIHGRQFSYIYNFITGRTNKKGYDDIILKNILKYLTNNKVKDFKLKDVVVPLTNENQLDQMYRSVGDYLNILYLKNGINFKKINKKAMLLNGNKRGIYSHSCRLEDVERNAIYCALDLTGEFPLAQTVLYCNDYTTEDEIISFIYRSIKCDQKALFIFIKPESLSREKKNLLTELLKELYLEDPKKMRSCLLFIYAEDPEGNKMDEAIIEIQKLPFHIYFDFKRNDERQYQKKLPNIRIYSSEISGLGKSTLIKNDFQKENPNYEYVYFPLGDKLDKKEIIERLLKLSGKRIALHLDLCSMNQYELAREFLFSFLVLQCYSQNENIFYYGNEMIVKVELPNDFVDFRELFPIFDFFESVELKSNAIPPLIVPNDIVSEIQIVCNYLSNIARINQHDIYIPDINFKSTGCITATPMSQEECTNIIFRNLGIENPNYYQIVSYISILAEQLIHFSKSIYLNRDQINEYSRVARNIDNIRFFFVDSLVKITKHFITSSYDNIIKGQNVTHDQQKGKVDIEKAKKKATTLLTKKIPFSFQNIRPSMMIINEDEYTLSIIKTCDNNTPEYTILKSIYQLDYTNRGRDVINYNTLKTREFLVEVKKVLNLYNPIDKDDNDSPREKGGKKLEFLSDIVKSYVFTADNFMKLILISLRLRTNIPVILMGETGCGKTSLIKIIANLKDITMNTLNVHAGIEDSDIIKFLEDHNLFQDPNKNTDKKTIDDTEWIFLDEINTCNSLGLITEIMLKNSCKGEKLTEKAKFIAACNPYRLDTRKKGKEKIGLIDNEKHSVSSLVYSVNPLPHSLLNFVFDFGSPNESDIKKYISNMVFEFLKDVIKEEDLLYEIQDIAEDCIFDAHEYIKNNFDISSVSLRDIRRLGILFKWFCYDLLKNPYMKKRFKLENRDIYYYSLNLSIYLCYYIRIFNKKVREGFKNKMKLSFGRLFDFEEFPKKVQKEIADAVKLEKGIAKNKALLENLFAIFVCLNTKIPLFIIGKPGCSKSLSAQLIFKSMNGKDSSHEFFRYFPKVYTKSYQGSRTSTSKGILKIFEKARSSLNNKDFSRDIISAIYFDEMGLAEVSKNNPLKVIHSQLEYDDNEKKVAFIGISNWPFDASKMNRGIALSIPEPDQQDLIDTAIAIAKSYDTRLEQDYLEYYEYLSMTYYKYKDDLRERPKNFEESKRKFLLDSSSQKNIKEFHGTRDFYYLIKNASSKFIDNNFPKDKFKISQILNESIERNFGGLDKSIKIFKDNLMKYFDKINSTNHHDVMKCIESNINDPKSRYLLVVTKSSISPFLITLILDQLGKNYVFYYGSNFEEDNIKGYYSAKVLNKVQISMNEDTVMILKNLSCMYPSLYDLFNQNFRRVGESNYARIALGNSNTQNYKVNDNFRCVVLMDKNELDQQDPPFLNRVEKQIIMFEYLLDSKQRDFSKQIYNTICKLCKVDKKKLKIDIKSEIINCDLEEIQGIIFQLLINNKSNRNQNSDSLEDHEIINNENNNDGTRNEDEEEVRKIFEVSDDNDDSDDDNDDDKNNDNNENKSKNEDNNKNNINKEINTYKPELMTKNANIDYEFIKEKIYEKIVPTFSQDLIFYFKNFEYGKTNHEEFKTIFNIYKKDEEQRKNLKSYLKYFTTNKNIIYTYSNILDSIFGLNESINNNKYGLFSKERTKNVFINQYNSERDIDDSLLEYYNKSNYNLCIIHFDISDCIHLNHINYLIENIENNMKERNNNISELKPIIFIIHISRITNTSENDYEDENEEENKDENDNVKIYNNYLISHLTKWKQIFIDNLNGIDISIKEIIDASNIELYKNKKLINLNKVFKDELFHSFSFIKYDFKINVSSIRKEEYIERICNYINHNRKLTITIQKLVLEKIKTLKENIVVEVFKNYNFEENDIDFISVLIKYMKSIYKKGLINSLIQLEKFNIISTKLLMEKEKELNNDFFENIYQEKIKGFSKELKHQGVFSPVEIPLILGISFPLIISTFEKIDEYIKQNKTINDYLENENNFTMEEKNNYINAKTILEENVEVEFESLYFSKIFSNDDEKFNNLNKEKLLRLLLKDYILYFLSKSDKKFNSKNILNIFNFLYKLFISMNNSDEDDNILTFKNISKFVLFIESYNKYIIPLVEFICSLDSITNNFMDIFNSKILENTFNKNKSFYIANDIIFNLYETITYCILNIDQDFGDLSNENFEFIIKEIEAFSTKIMNVNIDLCLMLKQVLYLQDFITVCKSFSSSQIPLKENVNTYLNYLKDENETYLLPEYFNTRNNNFDNINEKDNPVINEFNFLAKILPSQVYENVIVKLLNNKIKISKNENYRLALLKILCSNNSIINKSKIIFETIFRIYHLCPVNRTPINEEAESDDENKYDSYSDNEIIEGEKEVKEHIKKENKNEDNNDNKKGKEDYDSGDSEDSEYESDNESENESENDEDEDEEDEEDDDDGTGIRFLSELESKGDIIITYLNQVNNRFLDEVLLSLFDGKFSKYFNSKRKDEDKILNQSFDILKNCVYYIEKSNNKITKNNKLGVLYSISYIKYYCYYLSKILYESDSEFLDIDSIIEFLNGKTEFRKMIKIYILRILNRIIIKSYKKTLEFINNHELFNEDFDFSEKVPCSLDYLFLPNGTFEDYKKFKEIYTMWKNENFKSESDILEFINDKTILTFYDLLINEEISNVIKKPLNKDHYKKICQSFTSVIDKINLSRLSEKILYIFFNYNYLNKEIVFIQTLSVPDYEMLLYSHKFSFICSFSRPNTVYSNILSENAMENINKIYIPGGEPEYNLLMESAKEIQKYIRDGGREATFLCSCGNWYTIADCGGPVTQGQCNVCKETIGGREYKLQNRKGHVRILTDQKSNRFNVPARMLNDLLEEVERLRKTPIQGFKKIDKRYFASMEKQVRNISNVTYRILSFIFYSCIFYDEKLNFMTEEELQNFYYKDDNTQTVFSILKDIWDILKEELNKRDINNVQCFINMIIPDLSKLIHENNLEMKNENEREKFEGLCNQIIENAIVDYKNYYPQYINNNKIILEIKDDTIKSILEETSDPNMLSERKYPLIKYLNAADYPSYEKFYEQFYELSDPFNQYPVINSYFNATTQNPENYEILEHFHDINPFVKYVINKYSNKISRNEAKKITIKDEIENDSYMKKLFSVFSKKGWKKVYKKLSNYDCRGKLPVKNIKKDDCLAYVLNDNKENGFGKYISTIYKDFITYQNEFLKPLLFKKLDTKDKEYLHPYIYQIQKEIIVQNANPNEVVSLEVQNELFDSIDELIYAFSYRDFTMDNGKMNYINYRNNKFDFKSIEIELAKILLTDKRLFSNEHEQLFISYNYEGFTKDYNIISNFKLKIKNEESLEKEDKTNIEKSIDQVNYEVILVNLQSLFLYFTNKRNINGNEFLLDEIEKLPENIIKLDKDFKKIIIMNQLNIRLSQLIDLYNYIEYLNYDKIVKNVSKEAYNALDKEQIELLDKHFNKENILISKKDLGQAIQKLISRYLVSDQFNHFDWNIFDLLDKDSKPELWDKDLISTENQEQFEDEIDSLINIHIKIGQTIRFSEYLGLNNDKKHKKQSKNKQKNKPKLKKNPKKKLNY